MGGLIKIDFYYTTGTVKTVMDHPTTGRNELFRNTPSPEDYIRILKNPRSHTGRGYRQRVNRGADVPIVRTDLEALEDFEDEDEGGTSKSHTEDEN
eukprot:867274_1